MPDIISSNPRTATFLFTDLENSTPLWENHPSLMQQLAARHDTLMREAIELHRGRIVKSTGDGFHAVFETAADGAAAALAGQRAMIAEAWPVGTGTIHVRMGLHTGASRERDGDYYGSEVNRAARVMGIAHGGQILLSAAAAALIRTAPPENVSLMDLGEHRLRGLGVAERIFQVCHPELPVEFPPLKSLSAYRHNLPVQLSTFVGREKELADVQRLLGETHLLTLLGPGGTGKTRLMLESAEGMVAKYKDGVFLVELAPLTDPTLIAERVATALTVQEQPGRPVRDSLFEETLELARQVDNPFMNAMVHMVQGYMARFRGDLANSKQHVLTATVNYEALNLRRSVAMGKSELAHIARETGDLEEAVAYYRHAIIGWQELGHLSAVTHQVECFAYIALERGQHAHAARLLGAAGAARKKSDMLSQNPKEINELSQAMERLAETMSEKGRDRALAEGSLLSLDDAVQLALNEDL